ncbi:MAG: exodeoxyribonuclease VII large subunit [Prevotella sp.]|nr:exodeoxyribonuclease VII large subunit [Prevotella sp.]
MADIKAYSLLELNTLVRRTIELGLPGQLWVEAELAEARESRGHCYMELIQKDDSTNTPVARASAKCWRQTWMILRAHFERTTGQMFHAGMKVRLRVYAQFHEAYGFSWIVTDIDPYFTVGDMARRRQEIVRQLKAEGVFDLNRELDFPMFAQRIAVISSETAAGYGDFCNQLADNDYGFSFTTRLFPAVMQGEQVEQSVIAALDRINRYSDEFDCVVIIRGGGATSDMSGFDTLPLAENVANFPLPVITGIGHDRDESIIDMVAHTRVKTPTAAAALLISRLKATADLIDSCRERVLRAVSRRMETERMRLGRLSERIPTLFSVVRTRHESRLEIMQRRLTAAITRRLTAEHHRVETLTQSLAPLTERHMTAERHRLDMLAQRAKALDPTLLLRRGYSITLHQGRAVRDAGELKPGDEIVTRLATGSITATVTTPSNPSHKLP